MKLLKNKNNVILPIFYMALIFLFSSIPCDGKDRLGGIIFLKPAIQNILHIPLYGLLAFLWMNAFDKVKSMSKKAAIYTLIITVFYSFFDEFHQYFVPGRYCSLMDISLNTVTCLMVVFIYYQKKIRNVRRI